MYFRDREEAARALAVRLKAYHGQRPLVLGVPRGAVPMARIVADALDGDLDVVLVGKLRAPGQPELAIGAVDEQGTVFEGRYFSTASREYVREEVRTQREILRERRLRYTRAHVPVDRTNRIVIVVDDGIATGSSMQAAIHSVQACRPSKLIVAIGVAPPASVERLSTLVDEFICLYATDDFRAVGEFFADFSEVTDDMVVEAVSRSGQVATVRQA